LDALLAWLRRCQPRSSWTREDLATLSAFSLETPVYCGEELELLAALPRLRRLEIAGDYRADDLEPLANLTGVQHLRLNTPELADFSPFSGWSRLELLEVRGMVVNRAAVEGLTTCRRLRTLRLWSCRLEEGAFDALSALTPLEELDLSTTKTRKAKTVVPLGALGTLPRLRRASMGVDLRVTDESLAGLSAAPKLRDLTFWAARLTEDSAAELAGLRLTHLRLGRAPGVDDDMLVPLARRRGLSSLSLSGSSRVAGRFLARLPKRPALTMLELGGCRLEDKSLAPIARCAKLTWLSLANTGVGDEALPALASLQKLERVDLTGTKVTAEGLAKLPPKVLDVVEVRDDEKRVARARKLACNAIVQADYLALRITGTVGHMHVDTTLVRGDPGRFWADLAESLRVPVQPIDLEPGLDWRVLEYRAGELVREVDLLPALRIHQARKDGTLGRGLKLEALLSDRAREAGLRAKIEAGVEYQLSVRHQGLGFSNAFERPLSDESTAVVPDWFDVFDESDEPPPSRIVPAGWS